MIKLTQLLNELGINDPNKLIPGNKYKVWNDTWNRWEILEFENEYSNTGSIYFKTNTGNVGVNKKYYLRNKWIKPYKEEINELGINNPNPTPEEVYNYYLSLYNTEWAWNKIKPIFQKYIDKNPEVTKSIGIDKFLKSLPQSDLNQIYRQLKQINELEINNPNIDWERVWAMYCYLRQDYHWDELYEKVFKKYDIAPAYKLKGGGIPTYVKNLSQPELNKLYRELKQLDTHGK